MREDISERMFIAGQTHQNQRKLYKAGREIERQRQRVYCIMERVNGPWQSSLAQMGGEEQGVYRQFC